MQKKDFKKGQTVWVYLTGNAARYVQTGEQRIEEWEVILVGRKYITAKSKKYNWKEARFEIDRDFRQVYDRGTVDYILYLSKEDILQELYMSKLGKYIKNAMRYGDRLVNQISLEDLKTIESIIKKYEKEE